MGGRHTIELGDDRQLRVVFTDTADGDFRVVDPTPGLDERRTRIAPEPWSWLVQVHGDLVHRVARPGQHAGAEGDGLLTTESGCPIAVTTADCAPVVLAAERGVAVIHAGWRGLSAGIVERAGAELRRVAGEPVAALLGPSISPAAYEFGADDLATVVDRYGPSVAATTSDGAPALDVPAGVAEACRRAGWAAPERPPCTSDTRWYSHRTRGDRARQTAVAWLESVAPA
ncbi:MAG: polyphenol oxidase family protein [Actinomycetota bacterium]